MIFIICQDLANFSSVTWSLSRSNTGGCPHISLLHQDYGTKNISTNYSIIICKTFRVGPLGFMCLPDDEIPGNAGLLDQVKHFHHQFCHFVIVIIFAGFHLNFDAKLQLLALEWVHDHIADFGGDPDRVTIMVNKILNNSHLAITSLHGRC